MKRIVYRGADSIHFLASHSVTFTLPRDKSKDKMYKGWNKPGAGVSADKAIAHYKRGNNVGALSEHVIAIDIDFDFPDKVAALGSLAHTAKVWRDNANDRGALLYRVVDGPVQSAEWKPEGATEPHAELKAQAKKTGNYLQKNVAGQFDGGEYCIVDAQFGIKEITRAELILIWAVITDTELYPETPVKAHTAAHHARKSVDPHDDLVAQVKAAWPTLAVFEHHGWVQNGTKDEYGGEVRILGHGGLLVTRDGLWHNHSAQVGGDAIDAWAHCTRRDRDRCFIDILEEMANAAGIELPRRFRSPEPQPLPEGAEVRANGHIVLKTTPTPAPKPRPTLPPCTADMSTALRQALNSPEGRELLHVLPSRTREVYLAALSVLVSHAPRLGGWAFDLNTRDLGVLLGKTHMSASRNLHVMDRADLVNYRHGAALTEVGDAPPMHIDLSPIVGKLLDVTGLNSDVNVTEVTIPYTCNVYARFAGDGQFADATMRANPMTKGLYGRTVRPLSMSALNGLDLVARGELAVTRRQLVEELGMSLGSAAGATRVWEELGVATAVKVGRSKEYVFSPDWQKHLEAVVPNMVSFLGLYRVKIRNVSDRVVEVERRIKQLGGDPKRATGDDSPPVRDLHTRRKKMIFARQQLIAAMEANDLANRPQASATPQPGEWVGTPQHRPARAVKRNVSHRITEGDLIERRIATLATKREIKVAA